MPVGALQSPAMHANPRKTSSVRRLGGVDIATLREAVLAIPETVWDAENEGKPNRFAALGETRHIVFRFVRSLTDWRTSDQRPLWQAWQPILDPVLQQATSAYGYARGAFPRVMLARMPPGGLIAPHRDGHPAAQWPHKIHVPLVTNAAVDFFVDGVHVRLDEGEAVEINNLGVHAAANRSTSDRIHLIFEYVDLDQPDPDWIEPLVASDGERGDPTSAV